MALMIIISQSSSSNRCHNCQSEKFWTRGSRGSSDQLCLIHTLPPGALDGGNDANGVDVDGDDDGDVGDQIVHTLVLGVFTEQQSKQKQGWQGGIHK